MAEWLDRFTGQLYRLQEEQRAAIRQSLASELAHEGNKGDAHEAANAIAKFWYETYYERVFPLRFGREVISDAAPFTQGASLSYEPDGAVPANATWRGEFLENRHYPPILPAETQPDSANPSLLAADHHLATAALLNVCLRRLGAPKDVIDQARLGALLHELVDIPDVQNFLSSYPIALGLAQYLKDNGASLPSELQPHELLIKAIHANNASDAPQEARFCIVGLAAQRIKQYVYETPGLPEIRGASILLDEVVEKMAQEVAQKIGQECVLQTAASTLIFLAPEAADWTLRLKRAFYEQTLVAFCASAAHEVALQAFLSNYGECMRAFLAAMDADRYKAELPVWECLPFETRCVFCKKRASVDLTKPAGGGERVPICQACERKRNAGDADKRRELGIRPLQDAGILSRKDVRQDLRKVFEKFFAPDEEKRDLWYRAFTGGLNELVPETDERESKKQVAFIYGDGSNFGQITKNLDSLAMSLQWTRRAELVNRAAIALALSRSLHESLQDNAKLQRMPFEVLVIGGDDFSLFVWSRLALRFCQQFLELTDLEYAKGDPNRCIVGETPICYGVGCLISDEKAPAQRVVEFTEANLLKFAKRGVKTHQRGALAFLFTTNADQIPSDYKAHLQNNYRKEARLGKGQASHVHVYLTMQPLTACELNAFLECAATLKGDMGGLQRLAEPFVRQPIEAALLHFVYQRARAENAPDRKEFYERIMSLRASDGNGTRKELFPIQSLNRLTVDTDQPTVEYFAPILDLLEITKSLR
jgi:hypothetical protein